MPRPETLRLIRRCSEYLPQDRWPEVPRGTSGIYVLYWHRPRINRYDVVYVGMSDKAVRGRLRAHAKGKGQLWTHFSVFEVWPNITVAEIRELEGLLRHIFARDMRANRVAQQRTFRKLQRVRRDFATWTE